MVRACGEKLLRNIRVRKVGQEKCRQIRQTDTQCTAQSGELDRLGVVGPRAGGPLDDGRPRATASEGISRLDNSEGMLHSGASVGRQCVLRSRAAV